MPTFRCNSKPNKMSKPAVRKYGKSVKKSRAEQLFAELPRSPVKRNVTTSVYKVEEPEVETKTRESAVDDIAERLLSITLEEKHIEKEHISPSQDTLPPPAAKEAPATPRPATPSGPEPQNEADDDSPSDLRILTWDDVCPFGDRIEKIAEASYAEIYRITNDRGVSIIKVIRLASPIRPQTATQRRAGLVDEEPHSEDDLRGELSISEWLADIPGFVVYKERYIVRGKAPKVLLETHQAFHRRAKRKDPDRLQFYPSPSRYLDDTEFLVVELGDAGTALEDFDLQETAQLWDIFLHTAIALARAEDLVRFEHRDLHEGNLCIRRSKTSVAKTDDSPCQFGYSGLEITILDYGISRAEDPEPAAGEEAVPVAYDLEKDLSLFTSTHAAQCRVYREMRSFLLRGDRCHLPPEAHDTPRALDFQGQPISWETHHPYTNVLWLAYIYQYLVEHFRGDRKELSAFKKRTKELWAHLNPEAPRHILSFPSAVDVVRYAAEAGWITEEQVMDEASRMGDESIILDTRAEETAHLRRSPRRAAA
ncbi:hypothetical protein QBC47DRAFT_393413 [Echria macrotheca]|uniref:non-specific serine/threonine protein kinase n=1 Tax=Echria macrotheca TaxID=438768 RepID=A0AAJ0B5V6_9PEZI|nr:hypothetical protein QBC47DRAFT_393413 [Echria macrotheca]